MPDKPKDVPAALHFPPLTGTHLVLPVEAIDGDTVRFCFLVEAVGRLYGINAPESRGLSILKGLEARAFLAGLLPRGPMTAALRGREKYGRTLVELFDGGVNLNQEMIRCGHAVPYKG